MFMMKIIVVLIFIVTLVHSTVNACDMSALIAKAGYSLSDFPQIDANNAFASYNDPYDFLGFVMNRSNSSQQNDGYGILYYPRNQYSLSPEHYWYKYLKTTSDLNRVYYTGNYFNSLNTPDTMDEAMNRTLECDSDAAIIMAHARNATANPFAPGNHPFRMQTNGRTYAFMHNGHISTQLRETMINEIIALYPHWFESRGPNFTEFSNAAFPAYWIDSEVMFHYFMSHILAYNNNAFTGIKVALRKLRTEMKLSANVLNFIFSDGQRLYAFRSTPLTGTNSSYRLSYREVSNGFYGIRSGTLVIGDIPVNQFELIVFSGDRVPDRYPDFIDTDTNSDLHYAFEQTIHSIPDTDLILNPNPSNINVCFDLDKPTRIKLRVFNQKGQLVRLVTDSMYPVGHHKLVWNGLNEGGSAVSRGLYFLELQSGKQRSVSKFLITRNK